jgi:hypothetical protein
MGIFDRGNRRENNLDDLLRGAKPSPAVHPVVGNVKAEEVARKVSSPMGSNVSNQVIDVDFVVNDSKSTNALALRNDHGSSLFHQIETNKPKKFPWLSKKNLFIGGGILAAGIIGATMLGSNEPYERLPRRGQSY